MIYLEVYFPIALVVMVLVVDLVAILLYRQAGIEIKDALVIRPANSPKWGKKLITWGMDKKTRISELQKMKMRILDREDADCDRLGILHRFMHLSALSPTTRTSHAERHGWLFTANEIRRWMAEGDNAVDCECTFPLVIVDKNGRPHNASILVGAAVARQKFFSSRETSHHSSIANPQTPTGAGNY